MQTMPRLRTSGGASPEKPEAEQNSASAGQASAGSIRRRLEVKESVWADNSFRTIVVLCALAVITIVGLIVFELYSQSHLAISKFGWKFLTKQIWDPVAEDFGALPAIYGTVVSSLVALILAVRQVSRSPRRRVAPTVPRALSDGKATQIPGWRTALGALDERSREQ